MKSINALWLTLALALTPAAQALEDDHRQPIEVKSDSSQADIVNFTLVYSGNVSITQGSMVIRADQLKVTSDANQENQVMVATGAPATYTQMMENGKPAEAEAREIRYEINQRNLTLSGNAHLRQGGSLVKGSTISYDVEKQQLVAEGSGEEQITSIFMPGQIENKPEQPEEEAEKPEQPEGTPKQ